jgi:hypothetical protein
MNLEVGWKDGSSKGGLYHPLRKKLGFGGRFLSPLQATQHARERMLPLNPRAALLPPLWRG